MRKHLLVLFLLCPLFAFSQGLLFDKPEQDGTRFLGTYYEWFKTGFTDTRPVGFSINLITDDNGMREFSLGLKINSTINFELPKNGLLLIKCANDSIIELNQFTRDYLTDDPIGTVAFGVRMHIISGLYSITEEQIKQICTEGIKKIRIETQTELLDSEFGKKKALKIASAFQNLYSIISEASATNKSIRDDF